MRRLARILVIAAALAACAGAVIRPVDHACPLAPMRGQGSGCDDSGNGGGPGM